MHMLINAVVLAMTLPADPADLARNVPTCSADLQGSALNTQMEFADGYTVEGPWRVMQTSTGELRGGGEGRIIAAVIDRIVEKDALTGQHRTIPFGQGIAVTFEGSTHDELEEQAADLWCAAVMRMGRGSAGARFAPTTVEPTRTARASPRDADPLA
jgi:hypothetical protein